MQQKSLKILTYSLQRHGLLRQVVSCAEGTSILWVCIRCCAYVSRRISESTWKAPISSQPVAIIASDYISMFNYLDKECFRETESYVKSRIVWEIQSVLHRKVDDDDSGNSKSPNSVCLMKLFLCAYLQIVVFWEVSEHQRVMFEIAPVNRPECVTVEAELN